MICKVCLLPASLFQKATIMGKYDISYYKCSNCGFVQTEEPFWLEEAYKEPINIYDIGILVRNIYLSKITATLIYLLFDKNAVFLDYAGGYGIFTRLMRDIGFDFYWHDHFTKNLIARGFEYFSTSGKVELATSFESFEHFVNPLQEIEKIVAVSKNIFFSTMLLPNPTPTLDKWHYYGLDHGQHISFYTAKSLSILAKKFFLNLYSDGKSYHLLTSKKISPLLFKIICRYKISALFNMIMNRRSLIETDHLKIAQRKDYK